jgi:hypothetical protein
VRADIEAGVLHPHISIHDYGRYADREVRKWLGLKSWTESRSEEPRIFHESDKTHAMHTVTEQAHIQLLGEMQAELADGLAGIDSNTLTGVNRYLHPTCSAIADLGSGFVTLKKAGNTHAARVLVRTCIEAALKVGTVYEKPSALYRIAFTEHLGDRQFLTAADENKIIVTPGMIDAKWAKTKPVLSYLFPGEQLKDAPISAETLGQWSKMPDLYNFQFKLYCNYTHATLRAHATPEHFDPELDYLTVSQCLFTALVVVNKRLGGNCPNIDAYFVRVKALCSGRSGRHPDVSSICGGSLPRPFRIRQASPPRSNRTRRYYAG